MDCLGDYQKAARIFEDLHPGVIDEKTKGEFEESMKKFDEKNVKIIELLINKFPEIINQRNKDSKTGFLLACQRGNYKIVDFLLSKNPNVIY